MEFASLDPQQLQLCLSREQTFCFLHYMPSLDLLVWRPASRYEMHETVPPRPARTPPVTNFSGVRNRFKLWFWAGGGELSRMARRHAAESKRGHFTASHGGGELSRMGRRRAAEPKRGGASLHHEKNRSLGRIRSLSRNTSQEFKVPAVTM